MQKKISLLLVLLHSVFFVYLFYQQNLGLNLLVFELAAIISIIVFQKPKRYSHTAISVFFGTIITGFMAVINYSAFAIFINICSFYLFTGILVFPEAKSMLAPAVAAVSNTFQSIGAFFNQLGSLGKRGGKIKKVFNWLKIIVIPLLVFIVFVAIYRNSNPVFEKILLSINDWLVSIWGQWKININWALFFTYLFGLIVSIFTFIHVRNKEVAQLDEKPESIKRERKGNQIMHFSTLSLKTELKSGIFLLVILNVLLLVVNIIDINWVWFSFEWNGDYLKQFVHEGTYLLILSILISMGIVLFFFRKNLNFLSSNKWLKYLAYFWLAQNAVLTISVAIRNLWYIHYFALAYKRIGVIFFLLLTLYGIYTVVIKVKNKKSVYYLIRKNKMAAYLILVFMTVFNWDVIIAKYNFSHYQHSFVHLDFLSRLSDKALPYLYQPIDKLEKIDKTQSQLFDFEKQYMSVEVYHKKIRSRIDKFMTSYDEKNLKEWNLAEKRAYKELRAKGF